VNVGGQNSQTVTLSLAPPQPTITGVLNNASGAAGIQSGSWVSIYGSNLSATSRSWQSSDFSGANLPTVIDGVSVKINGKNAAVYYVSPGQLNVQAPGDTATGPVQVQVTNSNGSATGTATLQTYAPGFFTFQGSMSPPYMPMRSTSRQRVTSEARPPGPHGQARQFCCMARVSDPPRRRFRPAKSSAAPRR
jgi:uncharacterized protein (TIGR03437 family)